MEQALAEVAARVPGFKPPTGQALTDQLKRVAVYKSPGIYVVLPQHEAQARELKERAAAEAAGNSPDAQTPSRSSSPEEARIAAPSQQQPQQKKVKQQQQQLQQKQVVGRLPGRNQQPTPEPQRRPALTGPAADRPPQSTPERMMQLVEDDLGIPSTQPSPAQRPAPPVKQKPRMPAAKPMPSGFASAPAQPLQHQGLTGSKGQGGSQQQGKAVPAKKAAKERQWPLPVAETGKQPPAKPQQQERKSAAEAPRVRNGPPKQMPAPASAKATKRSRTVSCSGSRCIRHTSAIWLLQVLISRITVGRG